MKGDGKSFHTLATRATHPWIRKVYKIIDGKAGTGYVADAKSKPIAHTTDEIKEIQSIMFDEVRARYVKDSIPFQSLNECTTRVFDSFWNPMSGTGSYDDPAMYSWATTPVSMYPQEATAYYSNGGIATVIIDKKAKGVLINGYSFEGECWSPDETKRLKDYGGLCGFDTAVADGLRDGLVYGGAVAYPRFKKDNVETLEMEPEDLIAWGIIHQNCIDHWVTADRWNCVLVPNWNITARDYLKPSHYYIPIGGVKIATNRSAVIRPRMLPYWGMLPQIGWGISDFEGYISSILSYQICVGAIPIMYQQMSLLFHIMPLDGILAQNGPEAAAALLKYNEQALRSWSMYHPRAMNSFGDVKTVERHYEGAAEFIEDLRIDIGARSELPVSVIFPSRPTGLADSNEEDVLLKQAEAVKKISVSVAPQLRPIARILALSCFGPEYFRTPEGMAKLDTLTVTFETPTIQTAKEQAEAGDKFATQVNTLVQAGFPLPSAVTMTKQFFPNVEIPSEVMQAIEALPESNPADFVPAATMAELMEQGGLVRELAAAGGNGDG